MYCLAPQTMCVLFLFAVLSPIPVQSPFSYEDIIRHFLQVLPHKGNMPIETN